VDDGDGAAPTNRARSKNLTATPTTTATSMERTSSPGSGKWFVALKIEGKRFNSFCNADPETQFPDNIQTFFILWNTTDNREDNQQGRNTLAL
jgi:hypothetical protein